MRSATGREGDFGVDQATRIQELSFAATWADELQAGDGMDPAVCGHWDGDGQRGIACEVHPYGILRVEDHPLEGNG